MVFCVCENRWRATMWEYKSEWHNGKQNKYSFLFAASDLEIAATARIYQKSGILFIPKKSTRTNKNSLLSIFTLVPFYLVHIICLYSRRIVFILVEKSRWINVKHQKKAHWILFIFFEKFYHFFLLSSYHHSHARFASLTYLKLTWSFSWIFLEMQTTRLKYQELKENSHRQKSWNTTASMDYSWCNFPISLSHTSWFK